MSWWSKKPDPPQRPSADIIPFSRADRPDVLARLRQNADRHVQSPAVPPQLEGRASFVPVDFQSVDEALWKARQDIRRGLIDPSACLIVTYDQERRKVIWYQYGRENDEADAAFHDWLNEVVFDE